MAGEPVEVGQYVSLARKALVNDPYLANAAIIGELTKLTLARSGHAYFTLTDSNGGFVAQVDWKAPALTTVLSRFDESEVTASLWASLRLFRIFETSTSLFYRRFLKVVS